MCMPSKTVSEKTHIGDDSPLRTRTLGERMQINQPDSIGKEENNTGGQCTDGIGSRLGRNAILVEIGPHGRARGGPAGPRG